MRKNVIFASLILAIFLFFGVIVVAQQVRYVYLFVPNSGGYNSLSEINITDPANPKEVSRHYTVPSGFYGNPSRTAIDHYGNAWVGNRATNSLVKVGNLGRGTCVDRNGNGVIETSRDTNNNGVIDSNEIIDFNLDECILKNVFLSYIPGDVFLLGSVGCGGCHCSGAATGRVSLKYLLINPGTYRIGIWCSEASGGEYCRFRLRIDKPNQPTTYIESNGNYGNIEVRAYRSGVYSDCASSFSVIMSRANILYDNWYSQDYWPDCDLCDFYAKLEITVRNVDWSDISLEFVADDTALVYSDTPVLSQLNDGAGVRAVCVDANDNVYAGLYNYQLLYYISKDGEILKRIDLSVVGCKPYGCMVDKNGLVWISCIENVKVVKYDPRIDRLESYYQGIPVYGISPTVAGDGVVFSGWTSSVVRKIGLDGSVIWSVGGPYAGRGITVDKDDNVYAVGSDYGDVWKYDKNGNFIKKVVGICGTPTGIGLDYYENIWVACYDGQLVRLNKDLNILNRVTIGNYHYVYSDFTGYLLQEIVAPLPEYPIVVPPTGFLTLIPTLLGNPLFFVIVFGLAVAAQIERFLSSGGIAFVITFLGILLLFSIFGGVVPWWVFLVLTALIIGGIIFFKRK